MPQLLLTVSFTYLASTPAKSTAVLCA